MPSKSTDDITVTKCITIEALKNRGVGHEAQWGGLPHRGKDGIHFVRQVIHLTTGNLLNR